jgi:hypothetical protein
MGEVSKRCKSQWMRWIAVGLEAIPNLRLVECTAPTHYQSFFNELLQRVTKN